MTANNGIGQCFYWGFFTATALYKLHFSDNIKFRSDKVCLNTRDFKMPQTKPQKCPFQAKMSTETVILTANNRIFDREKAA